MLFFKKQIEKICELTKKQKIKILLLNIPNEDKISLAKKSDICKIKEEISKEYSISFIDLKEYFYKNKISLFLTNDPVHPNADGIK